MDLAGRASATGNLRKPQREEQGKIQKISGILLLDESTVLRVENLKGRFRSTSKHKNIDAEVELDIKRLNDMRIVKKALQIQNEITEKLIKIEKKRKENLPKMQRRSHNQYWERETWQRERTI